MHVSSDLKFLLLSRVFLISSYLDCLIGSMGSAVGRYVPFSGPTADTSVVVMCAT
jgi:hypothetical protein